MLISPLSLAIFAAALAGIWIVARQVGQDRIGLMAALIWLLLWLAIGVGTVCPVFLDMLLPLVELKERVFFGFIIALVALFALTFGLTTQLERVRRNQARIVRELALTNFRLVQMAARGYDPPRN